MNEDRANRAPHVRGFAFFAAYMVTVALVLAVAIFALDRTSELGPRGTFLLGILINGVAAVASSCGWITACIITSLVGERAGPRTWAAVLSGAVSPVLALLLAQTHPGLIAWVAAPTAIGAVLGTIATLAVGARQRVSAEPVTETMDTTAFAAPAMRHGWRVLTTSERPALVAELARATPPGERTSHVAPHACMKHETSGAVLFALSDARLLVLTPARAGGSASRVEVFASPAEWLAELGEAPR